jgi:hypothetical protein
MSWTTRKDYKLLIGIRLPIQDPVGGEQHEGQLWGEVTEELMFTEKHAERMYEWLSQRLSSRSTLRILPLGMLESIEDVMVETKKDGKAGYILFTPNDSLAKAMKKEPIQAMIEYEYGYICVGMGEAYTIRMLTNEFQELTQGTWEMGYRRLIDGTVVHDVTMDHHEFHSILALDDMIVPPPKIQEERGRGTEINALTDQAKLLQYWAWSQQEIEVGVMIPETKHVLEH